MPTRQDLSDFGTAFRQRRRLLELSQAHVARAAGVCGPTVSRIEYGLRPTHVQAERLAAAVGMTLDALLEATKGGPHQ